MSEGASESRILPGFGGRLKPAVAPSPMAAWWPAVASGRRAVEGLRRGSATTSQGWLCPAARARWVVGPGRAARWVHEGAPAWTSARRGGPDPCVGK